MRLHLLIIESVVVIDDILLKDTFLIFGILMVLELGWRGIFELFFRNFSWTLLWLLHMLVLRLLVFMNLYSTSTTLLELNLQTLFLLLLVVLSWLNNIRIFIELVLSREYLVVANIQTLVLWVSYLLTLLDSLCCVLGLLLFPFLLFFLAFASFFLGLLGLLLSFLCALLKRCFSEHIQLRVELLPSLLSLKLWLSLSVLFRFLGSFQLLWRGLLIRTLLLRMSLIYCLTFDWVRLLGLF